MGADGRFIETRYHLVAAQLKGDGHCCAFAHFTGRPSVYSFADDSTEVNASAILERSILAFNTEIAKINVFHLH
jgi:hypothetical protein